VVLCPITNWFSPKCVLCVVTRVMCSSCIISLHARCYLSVCMGVCTYAYIDACHTQRKSIYMIGLYFGSLCTSKFHSLSESWYRQMHSRMHTFIRVHTHARMHAHTHAYMHSHVCIHSHMHTYIHVLARIRTRTHTHTHTHTYTHFIHRDSILCYSLPAGSWRWLVLIQWW